MLAHLGAAHMADREQFGPPAAEFELQIWYQLPAWTVEEVVALSLGYDPQSISPAIIEKLGLALRGGAHINRTGDAAAGREFAEVGHLAVNA